ncbi:hypothetical protein BJ170DRAFT_596347 [Xylariales sp. AK1849]|nr:hypothetical protein BJ170DRAFT_596347 [Xylariales sp. AK1849]
MSAVLCNKLVSLLRRITRSPKSTSQEPSDGGLSRPGPLNKDGYVLGRGYAASTRLNLQHYLWKEAQGFLIHPSIVEELYKASETGAVEKRHVEVADLATGTGVWLLDLYRSKELQGIDLRLRGYDISPSWFPHKAWVPDSVEFGCSDLLSDPPPELYGVFDVVHLRLVISLTMKGDPRRIIRHIQKVLKPGGLLQWDELDILGHHEVLTVAAENADSTAMKAAFDLVKYSGDYTWVPSLPQLLKEEGFEAAVQEVFEPAPETFRAWTCAELSMTEEISWNLLKGGAGEELRERISEAYAEANDGAVGAVLKSCPTVTIARKIR